MASPTGGSAAMTALTASEARPFVIDRRDDAVILQPELLFERQPRQGTLLQDGKRSEDSAGHRDGQRNSENQPSRDRSKLEHGNTGTP
jgi:hypothetical protein